MANTDLIPLVDQLPDYLRDNATSPDEFSGGIAPAFPLGFLSIRGKEFRLRKDGKEANSRKRELEVIVVAARPSMSKRYFEKKYEAGANEAPDCSSRDGVTPDVAEPVHPNCTHCPKNQFGSRVSESGKEAKACGDYKRVIVWVLGMELEEPLVIDLPITSIKAPKAQKHTVMMFGDYLSQLQKHGLDVTKVVTKVEFTDAEHPQLCFSFGRLVSAEERQTVLGMRGSDDVQTVLGEAVFDPGPLETDEGAAPPQEEPPKQTRKTRQRKPAVEKTSPKPTVPDFPGEAAIMSKDGDMIIAQDAATWEARWEEGYRPQGHTEAPKDDAASGSQNADASTTAEGSAPAGTGASGDGGDDDDDMMAEVLSFLKGK